MPICYNNGAYVEHDQATVSLFDRGYLFADAVYEVVAVLNGQLVDSKLHYQRLANSLALLTMPSPLTEAELTAVFHQLISKNTLQEGLIYLQISRGVDAVRKFNFDASLTPVVNSFTHATPMIDRPAITEGITAVTVEDIRWRNRHIKSTALLAQAISKTEATARGAGEGIMTEDGVVTEGTSSSISYVKGKQLVVRPVSHKILAGITRASMQKLAEQNNIEIVERIFTVDELLAADEVILSSATNFIVPIVEIDGHTIGNGKRGPVTQQLHELYVEMARAQAI